MKFGRIWYSCVYASVLFMLFLEQFSIQEKKINGMTHLSCLCRCYILSFQNADSSKMHFLSVESYAFTELEITPLCMKPTKLRL